jgi:hypothetical protein
MLKIKSIIFINIFIIWCSMGFEIQAQAPSPTNFRFDGDIGVSPRKAYVCKYAPNMKAIGYYNYILSPTLRWNVHTTSPPSTPIISIQTNPPTVVNGITSEIFLLQPAAQSYFLSVQQRKFGKWGASALSDVTRVHVIDNWWGAFPAFSINNVQFPYVINGIQTLTKFAPTSSDHYLVNANQPITMDATLKCNNNEMDMYVEIQESNPWYARIGPVAGNWFKVSSNNYGNISSFNLKGLASSAGFSLLPGKYYMIKLAFGPNWQSTERLIKVQ